VVPDYAKSAATLLALGCEEIVMGHGAELGPLDAQIEHPDREGVTISALEVAKAFEFLGDFAKDYAIAGGAEVLEWTQLPRSDVLREFLRFTARFLQPAIAKLDPHLVYRARNQLDLAHQYAEILLASRRLPSGRRSVKQSIVDHLVRHYPVHEFLISRDEAAKLDLPVSAIEEYEWHEKATELHNYFRSRLFLDRAADSILEVWTEHEMQEQLSDDESDDATTHNGNANQDDGGSNETQERSGVPTVPAAQAADEVPPNAQESPPPAQ